MRIKVVEKLEGWGGVWEMEPLKFAAWDWERIISLMSFLRILNHQGIFEYSGSDSDSGLGEV